jgi:DNA-binding transcriptional MerR regulator
MTAAKPLTIGQLARRGNVATSLLRYYEKEGLLEPTARSAAGYRLYAPDALRHLLFIRKAQRYGFSLNDIKLMRGAAHAGERTQDIRDIAEQRFMEIERRVTEMLVLRHELALFLDDITEQIGQTAGPRVAQRYRDLMEQVCGHEPHGKRQTSLQKLTQRLGCNLARTEWDRLLKDLRGEHVHIWRDEDGGYSILYPKATLRIRRALERLAACEAGCGAHMTPEVAPGEEGVMFRARGANAFLFAQLFLALETAEA